MSDLDIQEICTKRFRFIIVIEFVLRPTDIYIFKRFLLGGFQATNVVHKFCSTCNNTK